MTTSRVLTISSIISFFSFLFFIIIAIVVESGVMGAIALFLLLATFTLAFIDEVLPTKQVEVKHTSLPLPLGYTAVDPKDITIDDLKNTIEGLKSTCDALEGEITNQQHQIYELEQDKHITANSINYWNKEYNRVVTELSELKSRPAEDMAEQAADYLNKQLKTCRVVVL